MRAKKKTDMATVAIAKGVGKKARAATGIRIRAANFATFTSVLWEEGG
jgi:hypothetical protein